MHDFICKRCGYKTHLKYNFRKHLQRRHKCYPKLSNITTEQLLNDLGIISSKNITTQKRTRKGIVNDIKNQVDSDNDCNNTIYCKYCSKPFSIATSCYRHQNKYCKKRVDVDTNKETQKDAKINELTTQVHGLLQMLMDSSTKSDVITTNSNNTISQTNNITNNTNQLQINNKINSYGKEDTSYITKEKYTEILKNPFSSLSKLINEVHFNDKHPENKNLRIPNKKQPFIEFYDDDGWIIGNQYKFVCKLFFIKKAMLHEAYLEVEDMLDERTKEAYRHFREETTLNPKTVESQLKDIQAAILSGTRKRMEYLQQHPPTTET
jgi:hypothetical protein